MAVMGLSVARPILRPRPHYSLPPRRQQRPQRLAGDVQYLVGVVAQPSAPPRVVDRRMRSKFEAGEQPRPGRKLHGDGMNTSVAGEHARPDHLAAELEA